MEDSLGPETGALQQAHHTATQEKQKCVTQFKKTQFHSNKDI